MSLYLHCDGPSCESFISVPYCEETRGHNGWVFTDSGDDNMAHFCSSDCLLKCFVRVPPMESFPVDG